VTLVMHSLFSPASAAHAAACCCSPAAPPLLLLQIRDIGSGNFGVAKLCRARDTGELVAVKYIERGEKVGAGGCGVASRHSRRLLRTSLVASKHIVQLNGCWPACSVAG